MTNQLKHHKKYTEFAEPYQLVLPLNLEDLIPDDLKTCIYRENRELPVNETFTLCGCLPDRNKDTRFAEDSDAIFMHMKDDRMRNEKIVFHFYQKTEIQYHMNRSIQVEGTFGVLKHAKIQKELLGSHLFSLKETA